MNNAVSYTPLEPNSLTDVGVKAPTFAVGSTPSFFATSSFLYALCFVAIVVGAFYRYVFAGILRVQANEAGIRQSNEIIKKVTLGLLGVFSLFIILFTVNKGLVTGDVGLGDLKVKGITDTPVVKQTQNTQTQQPQTNQNQTSSKAYADRLKSHNDTVARLSPSGIHTNHSDQPCTEAQFGQPYPSCTSLSYVPEETIQMLLRVNGSCRCQLTVTGGTEPGHVSHGENKRPVDLRINASQDTSDPLYAFIKGVGSPGPATGNCYITYLWSSFTFCDEKRPSNAGATWAPHFHVY
jgi:hypothetical protein